MKAKNISAFLILCFVGVGLLGALVVISHRQGALERREMVSAITHVLDDHSPQIAALLTTMRGSNVTVVEDAVFEELQARPSTSLISRPMIKVAPALDGQLECVIDPSCFGGAPRTIGGSSNKPAF